LWKCSPPFLDDLGIVTYLPDRYEGIGFTCVAIPNESWGDQALNNGKTLLKALKIIRELPFGP
jgi:hypothetical protein